MLHHDADTCTIGRTLYHNRARVDVDVEIPDLEARAAAQAAGLSVAAAATPGAGRGRVGGVISVVALHLIFDLLFLSSSFKR